MSEEMVKLSDVQERLRERIKLAFMDLIPDAKWDELIQKEIEFLTTDRVVKCYGKPDEIHPSELSKMVRTLLQEEFKKQLDAWYASNNDLVTATKKEIDKRFPQLVRKAAKEWTNIMGQQIVQQAVVAMQNAMPSMLSQLVVCRCGGMATRNMQCPSCGNYN